MTNRNLIKNLPNQPIGAMGVSSTNTESDLVIKRKNSNTSSTSVVDTIVDASKKSSSWIVDVCGICTGYMDKQVQYELMAQHFPESLNQPYDMVTQGFHRT